mgnify:CR=1 FL=1
MSDHDNRQDEDIVALMRRQGVQDDDPLMPIITAMDASIKTIRHQTTMLTHLYERTKAEITRALQARVDYARDEAEQIKKKAEFLQVKMVHDIGKTIADSAREALATHVKVIETRTIASIVAATLLSIIVAYGVAHAYGYHAGETETQQKADTQMAIFKTTASEADKLFLGRPEELALWAPIIRLNALKDSSKIHDCYSRYLFSFDMSPDQPGCWLPVRVPVPIKRPRTMSIPFAPPSGPPDRSDP